MKPPATSTPPAKRTSLAAAAALTAALAIGCATTADCDPARDHGLARTFSCSVGGGYVDHAKPKEAAVALEQDKGGALARRLTDGKVNSGDLDRQIQVARADVASLQNRLNRVNQRIARSSRATAQERSELRGLQGRIQRLSTAADAGAGSATELAALRKAISEKEAAMKALAD